MSAIRIVGFSFSAISIAWSRVSVIVCGCVGSCAPSTAAAHDARAAKNTLFITNLIFFCLFYPFQNIPVYVLPSLLGSYPPQKEHYRKL